MAEIDKSREEALRPRSGLADQSSRIPNTKKTSCWKCHRAIESTAKFCRYCAEEQRLIRANFKCTKTSKDWFVLLSKEPCGKFRIKNVSSDSSQSFDANRALELIADSASIHVDINFNDIVNYFALKCPHCGNNSQVQCGNCQLICCQGGIKNTDDGLLFSCPSCKTEGIISGRFEKFDGQDRAKDRSNAYVFDGKERIKDQPRWAKS